MNCTCIEGRRAVDMSTVVRLVHQHLHVLEMCRLAIEEERRQVAAVVQLEFAGRLLAAGEQKV